MQSQCPADTSPVTPGRPEKGERLAASDEMGESAFVHHLTNRSAELSLEMGGSTHHMKNTVFL